jgi:hypothetical protein
MTTFYNQAQPVNIRNKYDEYSVIEFLCKMPSGRQLKAGSFRLNGYLKVLKTNSAGVVSAIDGSEGVMFNQFAGVHSLIRNVTETINGRTISSMQQYGRYAAIQASHDATPEGLVTNSGHASELKGALNTRLLVGNDITKGIAFSMKPHIAINKSSSDLPQTTYSDIKLMLQLGSGIEALYITGGKPVSPTIFNLTFELTDLQLSWMETVEDKSLINAPITFNTIAQMTQTITGVNSTISIVSPTAFDAVSMSFLRQSSLNNLYLDSQLSEYVPDITSVAFTINGDTGPLTYTILPPCYQDIALNYYKSLDNSGSAIWRIADPTKNSIKNRFLSENGNFGIGCAYKTSINDKLAVQLQIDDNTLYNPSVAGNAIDCYIYVNGFITL